MTTDLQWKKNIFSNTYRIYSEGEFVGKLKNSPFSYSAEGVLNGKEFKFKTKGVFKQSTAVIDCQSNKAVGSIKYNNWMTKATIVINDTTSKWKYDNLWSTKWSLSNVQGASARYSGGTIKGRIHANTDDPLLLLSGLYVTNYYWQMTAVLIAVLTPIWLGS